MQTFIVLLTYLHKLQQADVCQTIMYLVTALTEVMSTIMST